MTRPSPEPLPAWITWPIRVLAVIFVVPVKLAWDASTVVMRFLWRWVGDPLCRYVLWPILYYALWLPFYYVICVPVAWVTVHVLWRPLVWLVKALGPFWRLLGRVLLEVAKAIGWALTLVYRYLLRPLGIAIAFVWRWTVVPVAQAVAWAWRHSVVLLWRYLVVIPVTWVWRTLVVPPARWVRAAVLHPIAETTRRVLAAVGLR